MRIVHCGRIRIRRNQPWQRTCSQTQSRDSHFVLRNVTVGHQSFSFVICILDAFKAIMASPKVNLVRFHHGPRLNDSFLTFCHTGRLTRSNGERYGRLSVITYKAIHLIFLKFSTFGHTFALGDRAPTTRGRTSLTVFRSAISVSPFYWAAFTSWI